MFTNKQINNVYTTRYIMSWVRMGGQLDLHGKGYDEFREWLKTLDLADEDVEYILNLAMNGKMELERSASKFLREHNRK